MILDGRALAEEVYGELLEKRQAFSRAPVLGILVGTNDPVIESFVRIKSRAAERLGVEIERVNMPTNASTQEVIDAVRALADRTDGIIVQLPLPTHLDTNTILAAVPNECDVDGINPTIAEGHRMVHAPVAEAICVILEKHQVSVADKKVVVVGNGRLVGAPATYMLRELGGVVSVITLESGDMSALKDADIVVLGAGDSHFVKPEMIKDGCVLLDAGTSEAAGKVVGDADPTCAEKCTLFTPVPGGIGPVAVAMIFRNLFTLMAHI